jgi:uncharacterized SAM-binding protein YcdF (DUF218 family)
MKRCLAYLSGGLLVLVLVLSIFLTKVADWLRGDTAEKVNPADVIVVLAGSFERPLYAGDLYIRGIAPKVIVSVPKLENSIRLLEALGIRYPRPQAVFREILLRKGVPQESIEMLSVGAISTVDEAEALSKRLREDCSRILIVTSPYHVRRTLMIFGDAFGEGARVQVTSTPYESFPDRWWVSQDAARNILLELAKIILYEMGGRFTPQGR